MAEILKYDLYDVDGDDDTEALAYKGILEDLIAQRSTPAQAAAAIDAWATEHANRKYDDMKSRDPPFQLTAQEEEAETPLRVLGPNPMRSLEMLTYTLAEICSAFPPARQEDLVQLVRELRDMPKHEVPDADYAWGEPKCGQTFELWPFGTDEVGAIGEWFRHQGENIGYPFSDVEVPGSEARQRWLNFQAFAARLTTTDLIDCSRASVLVYLLPDSVYYPDLGARKVGGPRRLAADLLAAAPWLGDDVARKWVHARCAEVEGTGGDDSALGWCKTNWETWKGQMAFMAVDERFEDETRELARSILGKMEAEG